MIFRGTVSPRNLFCSRECDFVNRLATCIPVFQIHVIPIGERFYLESSCQPPNSASTNNSDNSSGNCTEFAFDLTQLLTAMTRQDRIKDGCRFRRKVNDGRFEEGRLNIDQCFPGTPMFIFLTNLPNYISSFFSLIFANRYQNFPMLCNCVADFRPKSLSSLRVWLKKADLSAAATMSNSNSMSNCQQHQATVRFESTEARFEFDNTPDEPNSSNTSSLLSPDAPPTNNFLSPTHGRRSSRSERRVSFGTISVEGIKLKTLEDPTECIQGFADKIAGEMIDDLLFCDVEWIFFGKNRTYSHIFFKTILGNIQTLLRGWNSYETLMISCNNT